MQTATMTSAPKKKRDFYNGSQGLNFRDFRSPEPQEAREHTHPEPPNLLNGMRGSDSYPLLSLPPSQNANDYSSPEYSLSSPFPTRPSPLSYSQSEEDRCRPLPPGISFQGKGADFDDSISIGEDPRAYGACSSTEQSSWAGAGAEADPSQASTSGEDGENEGRKKKMLKRKQRCRLCANHGIDVDIKGHKWYCPYKNPNHNCTKCEITKKRQYYTAKQIQLTREQHQQHQHLQRSSEDEGGPEGNCQADAPAPNMSTPDVFPRMKELKEETQHILDENFLRQLDERFRPRITHH